MSVAISDAQFMSQLKQIRAIKQFLFEERVAFPPAYLPSIDLHQLNDCVYDSAGRAPTTDEWSDLDAKLAALIAMLDDNQRWKMRVRELRFYFRDLPLFFLGCSVFFACFYVLFQKLDLTGWVQTSYLLFSVFGWTVAQGAMGACAFLAVSASNHKVTPVATSPVAVPAVAPAADAGDSIDLTNSNLITIRIAMGAVFAFLLGAPISFQGLAALSKTFNAQGTTIERPDPTTYALILAPFLFGFSTSLVLALLNRSLETIKTLLGVGKTSTTP